MQARLAYVELQDIIDACKKQVDRTFHVTGLPILPNTELDYFGFISSINAFGVEYDSFVSLLSAAATYPIHGGYLTVGPQSPKSNLMWGEVRLENLALLSNETLGVTTGYVGLTSEDLRAAAGKLWEANAPHAWEMMLGRKCVQGYLAGPRLPMFRVTVMAQGILCIGETVEAIKI